MTSTFDIVAGLPSSFERRLGYCKNVFRHRIRRLHGFRTNTPISICRAKLVHRPVSNGLGAADPCTDVIEPVTTVKKLAFRGKIRKSEVWQPAKRAAML